MSDVDVHLPVWAAPFLNRGRWKSLRGGRGSSKSHTAAQIMILRMAGLLPDYPPESVRIASCRDFNVNLSSSVKVAVEKYIQILGLNDEFQKLAIEIRHRRTGSTMQFYGVNRNPDSFLSMDDLDIFWMEQAEALGDEMVKIEPTIRKPGSELWFIWNPENRTDYCWKRFVDNPQSTDVSVHVNYDDNPWWYPSCQPCGIRYDWDMRHRRCGKCGEKIWPGLWELEESRRYYEVNEPSLYPWMYLGVPNDGDATHQVLPYEISQKCVEAYRQKLFPQGVSGQIVDSGLDLAQGGRDKCAQVIRVGPCVEFVDRWPGVAGDLSQAASRANENAKSYDVERLYYDASSPINTDFLRLDVQYGVRPIHFGGEVGGSDVFYESRSRNGDIFRARNIQMADAVRLRANRTVQLLNGNDEIDPMECLFINPDIPNLESYLGEWTDPIRRRSPMSGKWELDKRGGDERAESPDTFDGLCLAFCRDSDYGLKARGWVI